MDKLPECLVLEILSRLDDSADVARCRVAWKTFDSVSPNLRSINLQWPSRRYIESFFRASSSSQLTSPLKTIVLNLISNIRVLESLHIGVENLTGRAATKALIGDNGDTGDALYLTDGGFVKEWLPRVSGSLKSLSISDFWAQSFKRQSDVLSLVFIYCHNLLELEMKHTWLSVVNINPMPMLTSLKLEHIFLDDENLSLVNDCFPNLQVLNLINVKGGLKLLKIHLLNLKTCRCTSDCTPSYVTLIAPNLIFLKLEFLLPHALFLEAPMLSHFDFTIDGIQGVTTIKKFENLKKLWLNTTNVRSSLVNFPLSETVESLILNTLNGEGTQILGYSKFTLQDLFIAFPNMTSLCFQAGAWIEFDSSYGSSDGIKGLKTFCGHLSSVDPSLTLSLVACVLDQCFNLVDVSLHFFSNVDPHVSKHFINKCMARWPKVNWRLRRKQECWMTF